MAVKQLGEPGFKYTEELKINIVYLLFSRYNGDIDKCSKGVLVNKALLAKWRDELQSLVKGMLPGEDEAINSELIYKRGMKRLEEVIKSSKDPQKITSALKIMRELEAGKEDRERESIFADINKMILEEEEHDEENNN
ncbi:hypothetical protein U5907_02545 [Bacteroidales bacterium MB20-C3-3]|nr:hypothetical protein U5907_02545 [Bacteroidales bacterium MB20-C3-3]